MPFNCVIRSFWGQKTIYTVIYVQEELSDFIVFSKAILQGFVTFFSKISCVAFFCFFFQNTIKHNTAKSHFALHHSLNTSLRPFYQLSRYLAMHLAVRCCCESCVCSFMGVNKIISYTQRINFTLLCNLGCSICRGLRVFLQINFIYYKGISILQRPRLF